MESSGRIGFSQRFPASADFGERTVQHVGVCPGVDDVSMSPEPQNSVPRAAAVCERGEAWRNSSCGGWS